MNKQDEIWVTAEWEKIRVGDMTEEHAKNSLNLLIRSFREGYKVNFINGRFEIGDKPQ